MTLKEYLEGYDNEYLNENLVPIKLTTGWTPVKETSEIDRKKQEWKKLENKKIKKSLAEKIKNIMNEIERIQDDLAYDFETKSKEEFENIEKRALSRIKILRDKIRSYKEEMKRML